MRRGSLQRELNRWLFAASLACAVVGGLLSAGLAYLSAEDMQDSMLLEVARWVPDGERYDNFWSRERHDEQVLVQALGKRGFLRLSEKLKPGFHDIEARGNFWRVLVVRPMDGAVPYAVAQQTELRAELAGNNALYALLPVVVLAIGFFLIARWVLARGLKPVRKLAAEIDSRESLSLEPLSDAGIAEEILPFTRAINRLLSRTRNDIQRQQRFIADAAHEMRTPVAGLNLLADSVCRDETQENQMLMRQGLKRLESLVTQLLDLARLQFNYQTHTQVVEADVLLRELIASVYPLAIERSVDLGVLRIENIRVADLDYGLSKIFRNGLSNAIRYIPVDGQINVSLFAEGEEMVFRIDDTGPGIDPAALKSVFEPFDRGSRAGNEGNGLGLAIAKQVALRSGGVLIVENLEGRGLRYEYRQHRVANAS
ncbi:sensor histidine kinase [Granulosicoccus antarcticus]|uniref:histidine kinase n=1 Tax=Granulosicoccus antarcticus IMCC3135 TaxID=1192854 RepID=A0A2Z2P8V8_9GAMM|nr:HAMP domain-containing sensor histidine kinase [Granulosicoccus antarcticus]ASJ76324.1 Sensor protein QseC [Granulosicoccus antarcticus IMCC3135]